MVEILLYLTAGMSSLAAILALLSLLGVGRKIAPPTDVEAVSQTVRTEADRVRNDNAEQARGVRQEVGEAIQRFQDSFTQRLDNGIEAVRAPVGEIGNKLDIDIAKMAEDAQGGREVLRTTIENKLDAYGDRQMNAARDLRTDLIDSFARTTATVAQSMKELGAHQNERLEIVAAELKGMADRQTNAHEALRLTVEGKLDQLRQENTVKLDEMRQTVDEKLQTTLEKRLGESFRTVSDQLKAVHEGLGEMQTLATGVGDLKRVLTNVKTRGTWAEVQIGILLEQFLSADQYIRNAQIKDGSAERVEYAIKFVGRDSEDSLLLPIDAKFPNEDYDRLMQAAERGDAAGVEEATVALVARVRSFAKTICDKYICPPTTTDFAILYLPTDGLFAEVLRRTGLQDQLQREFRVTIAGPTTLASMLSAFQMGFRSLAIQKRSSEVWQILGAVRTEFSEHGKVVAKLQRQLGAASNTIEVLGTRTRAMNRKLKDVETLPSGEAQSVLGLSAAVLASAEDEDDSEGSAEAE